MSAYFTAIYECAKTQRCVACKVAPCRVASLDDAGQELTPDVLCHGCFEGRPMRFKLTSEQDVFRDHVKAGVNWRIAGRLAAVATRGEPLRDVSATVEWLRTQLATPEGET